MAVMKSQNGRWGQERVEPQVNGCSKQLLLNKIFNWAVLILRKVDDKNTTNSLSMNNVDNKEKNSGGAPPMGKKE